MKNKRYKQSLNLRRVVSSNRFCKKGRIVVIGCEVEELHHDRSGTGGTFKCALLRSRRFIGFQHETLK